MSDSEAPADLAERPFDELVAELQRIVQALEAGNLPLEESIARYREALRLHAAAELRLRQAELTIQVIVAEDLNLFTGNLHISNNS